MRFTELTWLAISLTSRLGRGRPLPCRKFLLCKPYIVRDSSRASKSYKNGVCAGARSALSREGLPMRPIEKINLPFSRVGGKFAPPRARRGNCRTQAGTERTREAAVQNGLQRVNGEFWTQKRNAVAYWVTVFTASPTLKTVPVTGTATAEISSTSVIRTTPTDEDNRRMTWPLAGSLISRVTRSTLS